MPAGKDVPEIVVAVTGASGVLYGIRLLEALDGAGQPTALILTRPGRKILELETDYTVRQLEKLAGSVYAEDDFTAPFASGSHIFNSMVICPCSMKTLGAIACGMASNLVVRAAEVCLKEGRPLLLVPRETPLSTIHLKNMLAASRAGARIVPASPSFYNRPQSVDELVDCVVDRLLDMLDVEHNTDRRWGVRP